MEKKENRVESNRKALKHLLEIDFASRPAHENDVRGKNKNLYKTATKISCAINVNRFSFLDLSDETHRK